ncbi:hypothetical protein V5F79_08335 [Xanthobacter flavus]|uniref:winged helix domain-containing protein n=1 Tax=Xanthobacter flavus TaxID=281 RepID=UPI00372B3CC2
MADTSIISIKAWVAAPLPLPSSADLSPLPLPACAPSEPEGGSVVTFKGRAAWAFAQLIDAGERGVTPIERPAPRWSHYVFLLRRGGVSVETIDETHGGPYSGTHARYVLRSAVKVLERKFSGEEVAA